ncbi:coatomer protein complex, subunit alpha (xenin) [Babesia microti strain RI]|uniref:Coatomer protein complex, subunit alpha (Xenin) n=1 Tax=Babesia microti (strain RI) TaxID=1133968 RepID=A0A1N6LX89_BABMR|nr:coatomer protein complex, subunit alpha (xenin) [Babesia microti strain RI]SIO73485.1 coatomer protein complex, subunit alpha (xenin) [Babesia microti strain RI]|eukprot:XP_021337581.1 coatomer protein complex, subunit alpha (xenin) [Babesia microti strain RI]
MVTVKLDVTSSRVKGLALHPQLPLLLASLHSGEIQLWDYDKSLLLETLEGHVGPVRGIDFHSRESLFVSGGDDCQVVVWDFKLKRRLFALSGHSDYVRTVSFHQRHPWIVSSSDDQTFRVWNWQSRTSIYVITGHCHYVMCARFHPTKDLLLTTSLDHTARVWATPSDMDVDPRKGEVHSRHDPGATSALADGLGGLVSPFTLKFLLEGHEKGVNCGVFHQTQQLIVTCSDDKTIRIWRYSENSAWQSNILRSHVDNVSCVMYHPGDHSVLVSNSEDCSVKIWSTESWDCLYTFKRKGDRFWTLGSAERMGSRYIAAGHDSGYILLKLMSERPLIARGKEGGVYLLRRDVDEPCGGVGRLFQSDPCFGLYLYRPDAGARLGLQPSFGMQLKVPGKFSREKLYMDISVRPFQLLLLSRNSRTLVIFYKLPELESAKFRLQGAHLIESGAIGDCCMQFYELPPPLNDPTSCCFMGKGRVAVGTAHHLVILNCRFEKVAAFELPTERVYPAPGGAVFAVSQSSLYYVKEAPIFVTALTGKPIAVVPSGGNEFQLIVCRNSLAVLDRQLRVIALVYDRQVKSAIWDGPNAVVYTTSTHLKFFMFGAQPSEELMPGDALRCDPGILKSLDQVWYLASLQGDELVYFTRAQQAGRFLLTVPEYLARRRVVSGELDRSITPSELLDGTCSPSLGFISFLRDRGYPQYAFGFCRDPALKFSLARAHSGLEEMVQVLDSYPASGLSGKSPSWLGAAWLEVAQIALKQCNVQIAERGFQHAHQNYGLVHLYMLTGQFDKLEKLRELGVLSGCPSATASKLYLFDGTYPIAPISASVPSNGPLCRPFRLWDGWSRLVDWGRLSSTGPVPVVARIPIQNPVPAPVPSPGKADGAWSDYDDFIEEIETSRSQASVTTSSARDFPIVPLPAATPTAAALVASGQFDQALSKLREGLSLANPRALIPSLVQLYQSSTCLAEALPNTCPVKLDVFSAHSARLAALNVQLLAQGHSLVTGGDFAGSLKVYRRIMHNAMLGWDPDSNPAANMTPEFVKARSYAFAMTLEIRRGELSESDPNRSLQLAASLANFDLESEHQFLVLRRMMGIMWKAGNFRTTAHIARRLIDSHTPVATAGDMDAEMDKVRRILQASLKRGGDTFPVKLEHGVICSVTFEEVEDRPIVKCPFCSSIALDTFAGTQCAICQLCLLANSH